MHNFNFNSGWGQVLMNQIAASVGPIIGRIFIVVEDSDPSVIRDMMRDIVVPDPNGQIRFFETLELAYAACTTNANDVILMNGQTTHAVATGIAWSKSRIHVIGMDGGDRLVQQGTKIELTGAIDSAYVIKVTGTRNTFENLKVIQSSTHANALNVVQFAGEGSKWKNCSFLFGVADNLGSVNACEALMGEDSGTFINCSFGTDVLLNTAARNIMALDAITGGNADGAKSNRFVDCEWIVMSSSASAVLLKIVDTAGAKFANVLIRPRFIAVKNSSNSAIAITNAVQSVASYVEGSLVLFWPVTANCTNGCDTLTANVVIGGAPVFSSNAWEGGTPA